MLTKLLKETDIKRLSELMKRSEKVVLTCHVRPDGDAIGSTLGLAHIFSAIGKKVNVITPDAHPRSLDFLPGIKEIVAYTRYPEYAGRLIAEADLLVCCDFNTLSRIDSLAPVVSAAKCPKVLIDHHVEPEYFCDITFSFPEMSSTCELAFRVAAALGLYAEMNLDAATCLCTGLITDTQNFSVNCSDPEVYEVLMKLLEKGVDKLKIVREALKLKTLDSFKLQAYALSNNLDLLENDRVAIVTLCKEELDKFNYVKGDSEGIVNMPLDIRGVICSFFLREDSDCIKVSARSVGDFPVNEICKNLYGGGGHVMAAGGEYKEGTLEECKQKLVDVLPQYSEHLSKAQSKL